MTGSRRALLLSGGMDSIAIAYGQRPELCVTIDYGQVPAEAEIAAAAAVCQAIDLPHEILRINCRAVGSGDLAGRPAAQLAPVREWWPFRNQLLITLAAASVIERGMQELLIGCVRSDAAHQDGRPEFIAAMSSVLEQQEGHLRLSAPAIHLESADLIAQSRIPWDVLAWAHSCHVSNLACGRCRGCQKHANVVEACGQTPY